MATIPSPRTWTVGELVTAAKMNADLRDGLNFLLAPPLAALRKSVNQLIPQTSPTEVTWDVEDIDRDGGHSNVTNPSRYTAQTAGWYQVSVTILWDISLSSERVLDMTRSVTSPTSLVLDRQPGSNVCMGGQITWFAGVGEYMRAFVTTFAAGTQHVSSIGSRMEVRWVSIT
ncbi:hypothetical protein [Thermoactinospora rubra]|uniref:hypothetical protein n=1 Tax=Thermoactinospora rubra TaxID=1088767 RepID=UPI000A0F4FE3|nr:hypothetical protein [Thermoactinospora rubra]